MAAVGIKYPESKSGQFSLNQLGAIDASMTHLLKFIK